MYLNGEYVAQHRDVAIKLFKKASRDHAQAKDNLGLGFENDWSTEPDIDSAITMYKMAGDNGYILGWHHLGALYENGLAPQMEPDVDRAVKWYIAAAERDLTHSRAKLLELGRLPEHLQVQASQVDQQISIAKR